MRTPMISLAWFALTLATSTVAAEALAPEQQAGARQQAINQRRSDLANCNSMRAGQLKAGVPAQKAQQMYDNCVTQANNKYNQALQRIGFAGNTHQCSRPDGCAGPPPGGFKPAQQRMPDGGRV